MELDDGRRVFLRPIVPDDAAELGAAMLDADPETLHLRFLGGAPKVTPALLEHLTEIDYERHFAMVARAQDGQGVAVARYVGNRGSAADAPPAEGAFGSGIAPGPRSAEVAVAVLPEWRRVGVATALVRALAGRALECGFTDFTASFLSENRPVAELAHEGRARVVVSEGASMLRAHLADAAAAAEAAGESLAPEAPPAS